MSSIPKSIYSIVWEKYVPRYYNRRPISKELAEVIQNNLHRDNCFYCNVLLGNKNINVHNDKTIDHIIPREKYNCVQVNQPTNKNHPTNLLVVCRLCNEIRGNMEFFKFCDFAEKHIIPHRNNLEVLKQYFHTHGLHGINVVKTYNKRK